MPLSEYSEKISTKMSPQSLYLCGFPEVRVEMKVAPFRALTQIDSTIFMNIDYGRNEGCPF